MTLAGLLVDHPFADDEPLLFTIDESVTAGEARAAARAVAEQLGPLHGHAVLVQMENGPGLVAAMAGVWLAGGVYVPLNPRAPRTEVLRVTAEIEPLVLLDEAGAVRRARARVYDDDVAFAMWTSGTTGLPKPILHTHTAYLELLDRVLGSLRAGATRQPAARPAPNLIPVSMTLNAGLYNALFGLRAGAGLVMMERFEPAEFAELVRRFAIRSTVLPPAAMVALTESDVDDLVPLKYVRSITAPLSPLQAQRFAAKFPVTILNGYGQAEIGEVIGWTAADAKAHPDKLGAVGRPHAGVDIRIDDAGHLWVRPPNTAVGIDERRSADGFVDTGDVARIDEDGFVWIEGRAGDMINRGGNKVHPDAVEEVLRLVPGVEDAAVVGVPDSRLGEVPVAFLVGRPVPDDALVAVCREHLVPYKVPVAFHWVDGLPRSEVGKVQRAALAAGLAPNEQTN
jgi:acyl-coenzyme A synthetase/AMP-(fatty) acid ligase